MPAKKQQDQPAAWPDFLSMPPRPVTRSTAGGPRLFREVVLGIAVEARFKTWWRENGAKLMRQGWAVTSWNSKEFLQQWLTADGDLTPVTKEKLARMAAASQQALPMPEPELILEPLPGELETRLRPYQVTPARQLFRALSKGLAEWGYPGACDFSDMGTGKTYMGLAAALATGKRVVVLCPSVGKGGWERAFAHFGAEPGWIGTYEALRTGNRSHIAVQNADGSFTWKDAGEIALILDEAQALRHDDTLNVQLCSAAIRQCIPIICASATIAIDPREFRFAGRIAGLHNGGDDWNRFLVHHGCYKQGQSWRWGKDMRDLAKIHAKLFPRRGCRVRKEDLGSECQETEIRVLPIHCTGGQRIADMWKETQDYLARLSGPRAEMEFRRLRMKVWQACEIALVDPIAARVKADLANGRSVAIFVSFTGTRTALCRALNTQSGFYGGQPLHRRQYFEAQFQANRERVLINQIAAGGASVSLHDTTGDYPRSAYIFPNDNPVHMRQATGRVDRVGGKTKSEQWIPCVAGTVSAKMVQRARQKMLGFDTINDGRDARRKF